MNTKTKSETKAELLEEILRLNPKAKVTKLMSLEKLNLVRSEVLAAQEKAAQTEAQRVRNEAMGSVVPKTSSAETNEQVRALGYDIVQAIGWSLANTIGSMSHMADDIFILKALCQEYEDTKSAVGSPLPLSDESAARLDAHGLPKVVTEKDVEDRLTVLIYWIQAMRVPQPTVPDEHHLARELERQKKRRDALRGA